MGVGRVSVRAGRAGPHLENDVLVSLSPPPSVAAADVLVTVSVVAAVVAGASAIQKSTLNTNENMRISSACMFLRVQNGAGRACSAHASPKPIP